MKFILTLKAKRKRGTIHHTFSLFFCVRLNVPPHGTGIPTRAFLAMPAHSHLLFMCLRRACREPSISKRASRWNGERMSSRTLRMLAIPFESPCSESQPKLIDANPLELCVFYFSDTYGPSSGLSKSVCRAATQVSCAAPVLLSSN